MVPEYCTRAWYPVIVSRIINVYRDSRDVVSVRAAKCKVVVGEALVVYEYQRRQDPSLIVFTANVDGFVP